MPQMTKQCLKNLFPLFVRHIERTNTLRSARTLMVLHQFHYLHGALLTSQRQQSHCQDICCTFIYRVSWANLQAIYPRRASMSSIWVTFSQRDP